MTEQTERVFTATNALGVGIDAPTIRAVVHVGAPAQLKQYGQESGRAGRDGGASEAVILRVERVDAEGRTRKDPGMRTEKTIKEYLEGTAYRRVILDGYIDGTADRKGYIKGEEVYNVCYRDRRETIPEVIYLLESPVVSPLPVRYKRRRPESGIEKVRR